MIKRMETNSRLPDCTSSSELGSYLHRVASRTGVFTAILACASMHPTLPIVVLQDATNDVARRDGQDLRAVGRAKTTNDAHGEAMERSVSQEIKEPMPMRESTLPEFRHLRCAPQQNPRHTHTHIHTSTKLALFASSQQSLPERPASCELKGVRRRMTVVPQSTLEQDDLPDAHT